MRKKMLSLALALIISLLLLPTAVLADDSKFDIENGVLTGYSGSGGNVVIPDGVTSIREYVFYDLDILTSVVIPEGVTSIGSSAFSGCDNLTSVTIPDSLTSIRDYAFELCTGLTSVTIPDSVTNIGDGAFWGCKSLTTITVAPNNPSYVDIDGVLFTKSMDTIVAYPASKPQQSYTIPNSVTSIGNKAFSYCTQLTSVTIPDSVTSIGGSAFYSCANLTSVTIPDSVTNVGDVAFCGCNSLANVIISSSITSIGSATFGSCSNLTSVTIPNSVTRVESLAFNYCESLADVYYGGTENQWKTISIEGSNDFLTSATIHYNSVMPKRQPISTAYASTQSVLVDGKKVEFQMYALKDANGNPTNYVKLRDVASVLNGTAAQFEVGWDRDGVTITTGKPYTPNGSEMTTPFSGDRAYDLPEAQTRVNGQAAALEAIVLTDDRGGQYTYYKLRDLGTALGFRVDWSKEKGVFIETK